MKKFIAGLTGIAIVAVVVYMVVTMPSAEERKVKLIEDEVCAMIVEDYPDVKEDDIVVIVKPDDQGREDIYLVKAIFIDGLDTHTFEGHFGTYYTM